MATADTGACQPARIVTPHANATPSTDPGNAARDTEEHRFGEKLQQHVQSARADRHAQPDLAGPLGDRHEQDVHDPDAADHQRDRRHGGQQQRHDLAAALGGRGDLTEIAHREILNGARLDAMTGGKRLGDFAQRGVDRGQADSLDVELIDIAGQPELQAVRIGPGRIHPIELGLLLGGRSSAEHAALGRGKRQHDDIVLILAKCRLTLPGQEPDDAQRRALDLDDGANRVLARSEQLMIDGLPDQSDERRLGLVVSRE